MITSKQLGNEIRKAAHALNEIGDRNDTAEDLKVVSDDAKRVAITLYEFLCKYQGQEEFMPRR